MNVHAATPDHGVTRSARASNIARHDAIFYDGACSMCVRSTRIIHSLDWLRRIRIEEMAAAQRRNELPVSWERAMEGLPMLTRKGRTLVGFPAMRRALLQLPISAPLAALLYLPIVSALGARVYSAIATRRARTHACSVKTHK